MDVMTEGSFQLWFWTGYFIIVFMRQICVFRGSPLFLHYNNRNHTKGFPAGSPHSPSQDALQRCIYVSNIFTRSCMFIQITIANSSAFQTLPNIYIYLHKVQFCYRDGGGEVGGRGYVDGLLTGYWLLLALSKAKVVRIRSKRQQYVR